MVLLRDVFEGIWQVSSVNSASSRIPKRELIKTLLALVRPPVIPRSVYES